MTTDSKITIRSPEYDGVITWSANGKVDKNQFLSALLNQCGEKLKEFTEDGRRSPTIKDVYHFYGQPTECMDGFLTEHETHDSICEDTEACDFDPDKSFWLTMITSEQLYG